MGCECVLCRMQVGSLTSLFPIAYGFSKFVSGVLGARTSPTLMLSGGLMATAAVNLLFGAGNAMPWFMTFWAINGILQARVLPTLLLKTWLTLKPLILKPNSVTMGTCVAPRHACRGCSWVATRLKSHEGFNGTVTTCCAHAGLWRAVLRAHPDHLVRDQGARHVLGHVEHCAQPGRVPGAHRGRHRGAHVRLEVRCVCPGEEERNVLHSMAPGPPGSLHLCADACTRRAPDTSTTAHFLAVSLALLMIRALPPSSPHNPCGRNTAKHIARHAAVSILGLLLQFSRATGMWVPGATGLAVGALLLLLVRDSPEAVGYPPVETVQAKPKEKDGSDAPKESLVSLLLNNVLKNPFIWGMAFTYFFVYVVRQGVTSWFVFYLIKVGSLSANLSGPVFLLLVYS